MARPMRSPPADSPGQGARVAVLDNGKPHARTLMLTAAGLLAERAARSSPSSSASAAPPRAPATTVLDDFERRADLVITGSAD